MNIKRAFLIAAALMLIPGFALAQSTVTFETTIQYVGIDENTDEDNLPGVATATRVCNNGNPLEESFDELGPLTSDKVTFVVENFTDVSGNFCEITLDGTDSNWIVAAVTNNGITNTQRGTCLYISTEDSGPPGQPIAAENTCEFVMAPPLVEFTVTKEWEFNGTDEDEVGQGGYVDVRCDNIVRQQDLNISVSTYSINLPLYLFDLSENGDLTVPPQGNGGVFWHVLPGQDANAGTSCYATEFVFDSAVESDQGCASRTYFSESMPEGECTITNSVFFEGIPTLSQYGMAIMALLMLGMGFVGFRRFV